MKNARKRLQAIIAVVQGWLSPAASESYGYALVPVRSNHPIVIRTKNPSCRH
jgi:hypothetical protein